MAARRKFIYASQDAYSNIRMNAVTTVLSSLTIAFSLAIIAFFLVVFVNLNQVVAGLGDKTHVVVYVKEGVATDVSFMEGRLKGVEGVDGVEYVSSESAFSALREEMSEHEAIFEGVEASIFPSSFEIKVKEEYRNPQKILKTVEGLKGLDFAGEVQYGREWMEKFSSFLAFVELAAIGVGIFLAAAVLFIISNTIRLTIYSRRDEIVIMRLLGASDPYIRTPFILEGVFMGFLGGVLALVMLTAGSYAVEARIPAYFSFVIDMPIAMPTLLAILVFVGIAIGVAGSLFSLGRFLKV